MKSQEKDIKSHLQPLFPLRIPLSAGKASLLRLWSFGWFCKTERHVREQVLLKVPHAPFSTIQPRDQEKPIVRTSRKEKCDNYQSSVHFISSFPGLTAKSCIFGVH